MCAAAAAATALCAQRGDAPLQHAQSERGAARGCAAGIDAGEREREDGAWQWNYMFQLGLIIGGGTAQIQKNIIAERGREMPREPKFATPPAAEQATAVASGQNKGAA